MASQQASLQYAASVMAGLLLATNGFADTTKG